MITRPSLIGFMLVTQRCNRKATGLAGPIAIVTRPAISSVA